MKCKHQPCDRPVTAIDMSRYRQPIPLCSKHYREFTKTPLGSRAERLFLYRCWIVRDEAIDQTAEAVIKVL